MIPFPVEIANYRSIQQALTIPFDKRITLLAGPNNVGKSNAIRALALVANKATKLVQPTDHSNATGIRFTVELSPRFMLERLSSMPTAGQVLSQKSGAPLSLQFSLHGGGIDATKESIGDTAQYFNPWFASGRYLNEMGQSSSVEANASAVIGRLQVLDQFTGSTYLPHLRFITTQGEEPPRYLRTDMPGSTIAFGTVISRLAEMDRPIPSQRHLQGQLKKIEEFMAFCLERDAVGIEISHDRSTVTVTVDGEQRSLGDLGTGLEQLLMIGLASMGFPGKLVLIDEPEIHLHPRAQKRMMHYLEHSVDAQFVIATHSSAILDAVDAEIIHIARDGDRSTARTIRSNSERYAAIRDLGHSPSELVLARYAIWVEGPSDRIYLNSWIHRVDPDLVEGVDYSFLFYGGSNLAQHSYEDAVEDEVEPADEELALVQALSFAREFAVVIDSDVHPGKPNLRANKVRVRGEVEENAGYCWITDGREIENYIPDAVQLELAKEFSYLTPATTKNSQILDPKKASKVTVAHRAVKVDDGTWPLDLKEKVAELVRRISGAK